MDRWLYRKPFEGAGARRYASVHRAGFGDLDDRLIASWWADLERARTVLDLGAGPGTFSSRLGTVHPHLVIVAVEPSATFMAIEPGTATSTEPAAGTRPAAMTPGMHRVRARAEALPLAKGSIDVAVSLSSIRHVSDRKRALAELRRVIAPGGAVFIVELDPAASWRRIQNHSRGMASRWSRLAFGPLLVKTAPGLDSMVALARQAGFGRIAVQSDPVHPFYIMRLSS